MSSSTSRSRGVSASMRVPAPTTAVGRCAKSSIRRRVIDGASRASPAATTATAWTRSSRRTSLSRKPLAPARSASKTYPSRSNDVVARHVSVIVVQAEAAQEVLAARPDRAATAMAAVADTARSALGELRRLLGVLRSEATVTPQPDLAAVDDLVASVREAGLAVSLRTRGNGLPVAPVVGLTAYRVVQEALTNVLRHAHATRAEVELAAGGTDLIVTVSDDGRSGASVNGTGHGLVGMRERVSMLGGHLDAGPRPEGGFRVRAQLPLGA